jgi:hypothetical protein
VSRRSSRCASRVRAQQAKQTLEVGWERAYEIERLARDRVREPQAARVQRLAAERL